MSDHVFINKFYRYNIVVKEMKTNKKKFQLMKSVSPVSYIRGEKTHLFLFLITKILFG